MELIEEPIAAKIKNIGEAIAIASTYQEPSIELLRRGPWVRVPGGKPLPPCCFECRGSESPARNDRADFDLILVVKHFILGH